MHTPPARKQTATGADRRATMQTHLHATRRVDDQVNKKQTKTGGQPRNQRRTLTIKFFGRAAALHLRVGTSGGEAFS